MSRPHITGHIGRLGSQAKNDLARKLAQVQTSSTVTAGSTAAVIAYDDTIPQITEGAEVVTVSISPKNASSTLRIDVTIALSHASAGANNTLALFQDATADAIFAMPWVTPSSGGTGTTISFHTMVSAASTSSRTYRLRVGTSAGTLHWLSEAGTARYGSVGPEARITVSEILP